MTTGDPAPDVIVIGGGPGGSTAATMLARKGARVLLLERERFPRDHVGESLLPASIPVLEELGVLPAVQQAGFFTQMGCHHGLGERTKSHGVGTSERLTRTIRTHIRFCAPNSINFCLITAGQPALT